MEISEYQRKAQKTDQLPLGDPNYRIVPLLGMAGEVGDLLVEFKKYLRDGDAHVLFPDHVAEELGDVLWYLANTATKFDLDLGSIAEANLAKTRDRWPTEDGVDPYRLFDEEYPSEQQLPRSFVAEIADAPNARGRGRITLTIDGVPAGASCRTTPTTTMAIASTTSSTWRMPRSSVGHPFSGGSCCGRSVSVRRSRWSTRWRMVAGRSSSMRQSWPTCGSTPDGIASWRASRLSTTPCSKPSGC